MIDTWKSKMIQEKKMVCDRIYVAALDYTSSQGQPKREELSPHMAATSRANHRKNGSITPHLPRSTLVSWCNDSNGDRSSAVHTANARSRRPPTRSNGGVR